MVGVGKIRVDDPNIEKLAILGSLISSRTNDRNNNRCAVHWYITTDVTRHQTEQAVPRPSGALAVNG